jgi:hypothetical protein
VKADLKQELLHLAPASSVCVLLPLPAIILWHTADGRRVAIWLFLLACCSCVAFAFRRETTPSSVESQLRTPHGWQLKMATLSSILFATFICFSFSILLLNNSSDFLAVFLAFSALIPSLCVVPYLTLVTRKPLAAVVFSLALIGSTKLLGCVVVVLIYGWHADALGYTETPWMHPNLLVWLIWFNAGLLSLSCYFLGRRRYLRTSESRRQQSDIAPAR